MWILTLSWKADREGRSLQLHLAPSYVPCAENKSWLRLKLEVVWELKTFIRDYIEKENVAIWFSKLDLIVLTPSPHWVALRVESGALNLPIKMLLLQPLPDKYSHSAGGMVSIPQILNLADFIFPLCFPSSYASGN